MTINRIIDQQIVETPEGVRLLGYHSSRRNGQTKGLVNRLHGPESSLDSTYMLGTCRTLYDRGYDLFRLNFIEFGKLGEEVCNERKTRH